MSNRLPGEGVRAGSLAGPDSEVMAAIMFWTRERWVVLSARSQAMTGKKDSALAVSPYWTWTAAFDCERFGLVFLWIMFL